MYSGTSSTCWHLMLSLLHIAQLLITHTYSMQDVCIPCKTFVFHAWFAGISWIVKTGNVLVTIWSIRFLKNILSNEKLYTVTNENVSQDLCSGYVWISDSENTSNGTEQDIETNQLDIQRVTENLSFIDSGRSW